MAAKRTEKNESKKGNVKFFDTDNQSGVPRVIVVLCSVIHRVGELNFDLTRSMVTVTLERIKFGCVHKPCKMNRIVRSRHSSSIIKSSTKFLVWPNNKIIARSTMKQDESHRIKAGYDSWKSNVVRS